MMIRSWMSLLGLVIVILCLSATVLFLRWIQPKEGVLLRYDLDRVKFLRYNCTSRSPGANLPTYTWELVLEVERVGKGEYALTRTLTSFAVEGLELLDISPEALGPVEPMLAALGGLNGTFGLGQEGNLSEYACDEYSFGFENSITGEWVTMTTYDMIAGRGYLQEIPPLPGETILMGDFWNGTFICNKAVQLKSDGMDRSTIGDNSGYMVCEAVRRDERETPAGEFSVVEIDTLWKMTTESYIQYPNGTAGTVATGIAASYEGEDIIDISTGVLVYSVKALAEEELPPNELVLELVEVGR